MLLDVETSLWVFLIFAIAGFVKGVVGLGLPPIAVGLLTFLFSLEYAITLIVLPSLVTNVMQSIIGRHARYLLRSMWYFFLMASLSIVLGTLLFSVSNKSYLSILLGCLLIVHSFLGLKRIEFAISSNARWTLGATFGFFNGMFTGMTGCSAVPGVFYLQSIGLTRDQLIQAMGILFSLSAIGLGISLGSQGYFNSDVALLSMTALIASISGMYFGSLFRNKVSDTIFKKIFYTTLSSLGVLVVVKNLI